MMAAAPVPSLIVVTGVSGTGKTTIGRALAARLGAIFLEGDGFHSSEAVAKMRDGHPLDDADRWPWLGRIGAAIASEAAKGSSVVAACSALKRQYRQRLEAAAQRPLLFITLSAPPAELDTRLKNRRGHFMPASLLGSQLAAYEPLASGERGLTIATVRSPGETAGDIMSWLQELNSKK